MGEFVLLPQEVLNDLTKKVDTLLKLVMDNAGKSRKLGDWIPESEARSILNLKATSLWSLRKQNRLKWKKIGRQVYYYRPSIEQLLEE